MASQVQLANTFNEFRQAYNDAANDISTLQSANASIFGGTSALHANTIKIEDLNVGGGRLLVSRAPVSGTGAFVDDDSELTYDVTTNRLTVGGPVDANGAVRVTSLTANTLTQGRIALVGADGILQDDAELRYVSANNTLAAANVTVDVGINLSSLTQGRVLIAGASGAIRDDSGIVYNSSTDALSVSGSLTAQSITSNTTVTATTWANAANMFVSANVNAGDTVNAASHLHAGGVADWIIAKQEDQDVHLVLAVAESDGPHDVAVVNRSNSANAYAEFIAFNNAGNVETGWVSLGINATNYDQGAFAVTKGEDAYILYQAPVGTTKNGDLVIGTGGNGTTNRIIFSANGFDDPANNTQLTIDPGNRIHIEVPTQSTSTTTGALTVAGGIGVVGNMNVGGNVTITGSISLLGAGNTVSTDTLAVANSMLFLANGNASDALDIGVVGQYQQGAPKYFGLVRDQSDGVFKLFLDATTRPANTVNFGQAGLNYGSVQIGELYTSNTTATSSSTTGSLRVAGGAGIAGGVWAGGAVRTDSTTVSTSTSTGALIVGGGAGIAGNTNIGGIIKTTDSTASTSTSTGALIVGGGAGIAGATYIGGILDVARSTQQTDIDGSSQVVLLRNTSADTAGNLTGIRYRQDNGTNAAQGFVGLSSTGADATRARLVIASPNPSGNAVERIGISSSGNTIITATTASTSTATGALLVAGGVGVVGNTHIGGDLNVAGSIIANEIVEGVTDVAVSTNTYSVDYNNGNIFYATTAPASGDFTLALTNVPTTNGRVTNITLILPQGATARRPSANAISINGTSTLVNWVGGNTSFTPTASKTDIFNFTILRRSSAFTVAGTVTANTAL